MGQWHTTGCVLCAQNCGLQVLVDAERNRIARVRGDKDNPRSKDTVGELEARFVLGWKTRFTDDVLALGFSLDPGS